MKNRAQEVGELQQRRRRRRRKSYGIQKVIFCGLIFFVLAGMLLCWVVESGGDAGSESLQANIVQQNIGEVRNIEIEQERPQEEEPQGIGEEAVEQEAEQASDGTDPRACFAVQPGVPVGTFDAPEGEKVVYLTFDDGPSAKTPEVLEILKKYDAKATFFVVHGKTEFLSLIKTTYEQGHTIGLHTNSHDYAQVYASVDAYFADLDAIGQIVKEQIGYVPCFIRFPGGASNTVSSSYCPGIMTELSRQVQERGYQYYDWNCGSGDAGGSLSADEIVANATSCDYCQIMILFHDSITQQTTIEALPRIIEHYQAQGYEFRAIDRGSFVAQHGINN